MYPTEPWPTNPVRVCRIFAFNADGRHACETRRLVRRRRWRQSSNERQHSHHQRGVADQAGQHAHAQDRAAQCFRCVESAAASQFMDRRQPRAPESHRRRRQGAFIVRRHVFFCCCFSFLLGVVVLPISSFLLFLLLYVWTVVLLYKTIIIYKFCSGSDWTSAFAKDVCMIFRVFTPHPVQCVHAEFVTCLSALWWQFTQCFAWDTCSPRSEKKTYASELCN